DILYSFRSDLVHGNAELANKEIYFGHLSEARDFARAIVLWMLGYLCHVAEHVRLEDLPTRENLLALLDMDAEARNHTATVLRNLPGDFPNVGTWLET